MEKRVYISKKNVSFPAISSTSLPKEQLDQTNSSNSSDSKLDLSSSSGRHSSDEDEHADTVQTKSLLQSSDLTRLKALNIAVSSLPPRWQNWVVRSVFSLFMISGFTFLIYLGPLALLILILLIQVKCFHEIISVGYAVYKVHKLPWFRSLSWYFLITSNYFFYGESLVNYFGILTSKLDFMQHAVAYHRFISFALYITGFIWFVLSLVKKYYMRQFSLFAWTHVALFIVVAQSYLIMQNMFEGLIWFLVPVSMIICNDIMAYLFGFFLGKTPLIKLSPKKTWEGFIGGGIATIVFGTLISHVFCQYNYFVCPIDYSNAEDSFTDGCVPSSLFQLTEYDLHTYLGIFAGMAGLPSTVVLYPFVLHSLALSLFSSVIGPFGGFFASGFKRAFKVKDFGDAIPGHGGIMDRFDCQFLMATFVNAYIYSFIRGAKVQDLIQELYLLSGEQQVQIFEALNKTLGLKELL